MVRLFILFLIALLPLRGWTMERMVFAMDHAAPVVSVSVAEPFAMPEDCALHSVAASDAAAEEGAQAPKHAGCQHCQLCMPLAGLQSSTPVAVTATPQVLSAPLLSRFVSADAARRVKPPIS